MTATKFGSAVTAIFLIWLVLLIFGGLISGSAAVGVYLTEQWEAVAAFARLFAG